MSILIENMRREGFEMSVSPPKVLFRDNPDVPGAIRGYARGVEAIGFV
jgi:predicted membrane GTPase involved in stress response